MMDRETLLESIPAYALGALDEDERQQVERLLHTDAEAQERLAEYETIADVLVMDAPLQQAPAHLRNNLRDRLAQQRPAAPETTAPANVTTFPPQAQSPQRQTSRSVWVTAAAAVFVLLVAAGVIGVLMLNTGDAPRPSGEIVWAQLNSEADTQRFDVEVRDFEGVTGGLLVSADGSQAVLRVANFPEIDEDQTFQFWFITEDDDLSGGTWFPRADREEFFIVLDLDVPLEEIVRIGCSIEPAGGSEEPTGPRVFNIPLRSA